MPSFHITFPGDKRLKPLDETTNSIRDTVVLINTLGEIEDTKELLDLVDELNDMPRYSVIVVYPTDKYIDGYTVTRLE